ncbi:MAG: discoidin domain-containing protein [Armatimonadetes bacterium]|nr:discoidin domain-containing protein [Armatimonadota bacterium]
MKASTGRLARLLMAAGLVWCSAQSAFGQAGMTNLALGKPVSVTSSEDENPAKSAVDGKDDTRWSADSGALPQQLQIDLGEARDVGGVTIRWAKDGAAYGYKVEGSVDKRNWTMLSDQRQNGETVALHRLLVAGKGVRYVLITVTGTEPDTWPSICEAAVYSADDTKKLSADELKSWWGEARPDLAAGRPTSSSSDQDGHPSGHAVDGDMGTRWCANGGTVPAWWQVDLGKPHDLTGLSVVWEQAGKNYLWKVEGSADGQTWQMLSDQTATKSERQSQKVTLDAKGIGHVRVTVTGAPDGSWPSIWEVKVYGQ